MVKSHEPRASARPTLAMQKSPAMGLPALSTLPAAPESHYPCSPADRIASPILHFYLLIRPFINAYKLY